MIGGGAKPESYGLMSVCPICISYCVYIRDTYAFDRVHVLSNDIIVDHLVNLVNLTFTLRPWMTQGHGVSCFLFLF